MADGVEDEDPADEAASEYEGEEEEKEYDGVEIFDDDDENEKDGEVAWAPAACSDGGCGGRLGGDIVT